MPTPRLNTDIIIDHPFIQDQISPWKLRVVTTTLQLILI